MVLQYFVWRPPGVPGDGKLLAPRSIGVGSLVFGPITDPDFRFKCRSRRTLSVMCCAEMIPRRCGSPSYDTLRMRCHQRKSNTLVRCAFTLLEEWAFWVSSLVIFIFILGGWGSFSPYSSLLLPIITLFVHLSFRKLGFMIYPALNHAIYHWHRLIHYKNSF
jgi:hypothetical protein